MINVLGHKFSECQHRYKMAYRCFQLDNASKKEKQKKNNGANNNESVVTKNRNVEIYLNFWV